VRRPKGARSGAIEELVPAELVDRCKAGDQQAWRQLVEATNREVYTVCLRILRDPHDAAEATQDTYLKVWRGLKGFRGEALFTTWLYRVATNAALSKQRSRGRRRRQETEAEEELLEQMPSQFSTESAAGARLELRDVDRALETLPEHYRSAIVLRDVYGLTMEEVAGQLRISETAAKVRVHRARKKLREMLYESDDDGTEEPT
jgi:RNA polymerase sigma-70 factor, ECF subfamily